MSVSFRKFLLVVFLPLLAILAVYYFIHESRAILQGVLAAAPILVVLIAIIAFRMGGYKAGPIGLLTGILIALIAFGLNPAVLGVALQKGFFLAIFVLAVFFPAMLLYNIVNQADGIHAIVRALESLIQDRAILLLVVAWAFSALMEGLAGFGLPVAIISPMLVGLGVSPVLAVAAVAVGHAWSVTFGDMGVVFQSLASVVTTNPHDIAQQAGLLLGITCLFCGFSVLHLLKLRSRWLVVILMAVIMSVVQFVFVSNDMPEVGSLFAGTAGVLGGMLINWVISKRLGMTSTPIRVDTALQSALLSYGALSLILVLIVVIRPVHHALAQVTWNVSFPAVQTLEGFITPAVAKQSYRPLLHPGSAILLVAVLSYLYNQRARLYKGVNATTIFQITWRSTWPAMAGILSMVELSALMDHSGMTQELAQSLSALFSSAYPLISPAIGMLGAFATGSNNNSNVLFGPLQENIATILKITPALIIAAQTTGGSIGSMVAPAKILVGCSTVGLQGRDGDVLRITMLYGLLIGLAVGVVTWALAL